MSALDDLRRRVPFLWVTWGLIALNLVVFGAMLLHGAGLWHSPNGVQLVWGANFGPATQDGEWWRLGSAMFLHFGLVHLALNMWALWDGGQWVERMLGSWRFAFLYVLAGLFGNLLSLVTHEGRAVSGGASGAIFGVYGALVVYVWLQRSTLPRGEFRWLFWGGLGFCSLTIVFGLLIPGIDHAAHVGGMLAGVLLSFGFVRQTVSDQTDLIAYRVWLGPMLLGLCALGLLSNLPEPAYRWRDELQVRQEISQFVLEDAQISRAWNRLLYFSKAQGMTFDQLASELDEQVVRPYESSFQELSTLPADSSLPSAETLDRLLHYAEQRRDASRALADGLRKRDKKQIEQALEEAQRTVGR